MKFKSKYNIGDIVEFTQSHMNYLGRITKITVSYVQDLGVIIKYQVILVGKNSYVINEVYEGEIYKRLNKPAFEKAYAGYRAKQIIDRWKEDDKQ